MTRKSYISRIKKYLFLDKKTKMRIVEGIQTEIQVALDNGETLDVVIARMGSAKEVAAEYNQSYKDTVEYKVQRRVFVIKRIAIVTLAIAAISIGISQIGTAVFFSGENVTTVGGVSGPENVTFSKTPLPPLYYFNIIDKISWIALVAFALSVAIWIMVVMKRNKEDVG
jgi:uncharacterized membrane protein